jgi:hypothetical protein
MWCLVRLPFFVMGYELRVMSYELRNMRIAARDLFSVPRARELAQRSPMSGAHQGSVDSLVWSGIVKGSGRFPA